MMLPDKFSVGATIDINVPIEWKFSEPFKYEVEAKVKRANRFIRALARLCKRFGYKVEIEIRESDENKKPAE